MDILSGTYSRMDQDMAGTFQVLWGSEDGFRTAEELKGTDDEPLIIPATEDEMMEKICTRPFACDIDADGDLDLIVGNFAGTFYQFEGEGQGKFSPEPTQLKTVKGKAIMVAQHSDPMMFDWDSDGDLDIVSGSGNGGVSVSINEGTADEAQFTRFASLFKAKNMGSPFNSTKLGDAHITGPQSSTRVWIEDINGDGKFDIIVGDSTSISNPAEGVEEDEIEDLLAKWSKEQEGVTQEYMAAMQELQKAQQMLEKSNAEEGEAKKNAEDEVAKLQEALNEYQPKIQEVYKKREKIVEHDMTGFVWVYYQK